MLSCLGAYPQPSQSTDSSPTSSFVSIRVHSWLKSIALILMLSVTATAQAKDGVILLHGLVRTKASMEKMEAALTEAGYTVANIDYPSRTATITQLAEDTISAALASKALNDCERIHFVTHSLGGILVRSYFSDHTEPRLGRVVMLGPPNRGSEVVDQLKSWTLFQKLNGPAGSELGTDPDSTPNQLGAVEFELGIIAGDRSINWINSFYIPGKDDGKVSVEHTEIEGMTDHIVIHATHPYLMKNKTVIRQTIAFLESGKFADMQD